MKLHSNVEAPSREERLGSITGYVGTIKDLNEQVQGGTLKNRGRCFSQATTCSNMCAVGSVTEVRDAVVIYHSPVGCMSGAAQSLWLVKKVNERRGTKTHARLLGTDLVETDTIFGAEAELKTAILEAYRRYQPNAVFIAASCVSGIIGEDLEAVAAETTAELSIPVIPVHCEGFKSGVWASGFDAADHAILTYLVKPPREKRNVVNFKNFRESARTDIVDLFRQIGVDDVQFLYSTITTEDIAHLSEARATVCICSTLGTYIGNGLQDLYGVPYIQTLNPVGIIGFEAWLREIGRVIGEEEKVEAYLARERAEWLPKIEEAKKKLKGLRVVVGMGASFAFQTSRLVQELGMEVAFTMAWHLDPEYDNGERSQHLKHLAASTLKDFEVSVADQQNYELYTVLNKYKPDLYLGRHPGNVIWAIKQGIPSLFMVEEYATFGYKRYYRFIHALLDLLSNRSFADKIASKITLPYSDWWYNQEYSSMYAEVAE
ncbi:MAG: nitrogenase [Peptococcaceae bacterium]|jgi:nitrogenase molybdenum-iron protein alpha chain|nr:nitrogenase [Peptococcaceae bacterium]